MNNYILLEGIEVYVFLFLFLSLVIIGMIGIVASIKHDLRFEKIKEELNEQKMKTIALNRENMRLKLKYGELKVGENVDV